MKKVCYKVSLSEHCQRQSCKAFIGPFLRGKMIRWELGRLLLGLCENLAEADQPLSNKSISNQYSLVAPQP